MAAVSPRSPSSSPSSPRRHIHSSFPHYFYSTPATPAPSDSLSAFVVLCESRLSESAATPPPPPQSNSDTAEFAFGFNRSISLDVAFAEDIFREGRLLPVAPAQPAAAAATPPLKPPPRLQYITNIRKSLRMRNRMQQQAWKVTGSKKKKKEEEEDDDPFVVAVEKVTREDAPWCQLPRSRRPKACATDDNDDDVPKAVKRRGVVECVKSAISTKRNINDVLLRKEEESAWLIRKSSSGHGKFLGLARCTTVSRYRNTRYGSGLLACFGFK